MIANKEVPSANNRILLEKPLVISLMYNKNKKGPRTEPCSNILFEDEKPSLNLLFVISESSSL